MQWDLQLFSIEDRGGDEGYFLNHSCDSNLWFKDAFTLKARRDIRPGDELTVDYALFEHEDGYVAIASCSCDSPGCRHTITGGDCRKQEVRERYSGHFSPLINRRMADEDD